MKVLKQVRKITQLSKSTREKQSALNVSEVFHLWNHLVQRYNIIHLTNYMEVYASDVDLKLILALGKKTLGDHVSQLEKLMMEYGIPMPNRPPKLIQPTSNIEAVTDRFIYRRVLRGIQNFLPTHIAAYTHSTSPDIRELFLHFLTQELKLYDRFVEYGKFKSYEVKPPSYKDSQ